MVTQGYQLLADWFDGYYRPRRLPDNNPETRRKYEILFRHFGRFLGRSPGIADLNEDSIVGFLSAFARGHHPVTTNSSRSQLLALARYAHAKGFIREVPDVAKLKEPRRLPDAWTVEQVGLLLGAARQTRGEICGLPSPRYWSAVILLAYDTGLRAGALFSLPRENVDLCDRTVFARAEIQKQYADQLLRFAEDTAEAITSIWFPERYLLFPWQKHRASLYNHWHRIVGAAGLRCTRRDQFQKFRRTNATIGKRHGADATAQLGHSSDYVTRRHYLAPEASVQAADVMPRPKAASPAHQLRLF